jgi:hypothetical protein
MTCEESGKMKNPRMKETGGKLITEPPWRQQA